MVDRADSFDEVYITEIDRVENSILLKENALDFNRLEFLMFNSIKRKRVSA